MMLKTKTALVTGAHGFIGRYVAKHLSENGWYVIGVGHGNWINTEEQKEWGVSEWFNSNLNVEILSNIKHPLDSIIHCAGSASVAYSFQNPLQDFEKGVLSLINVLDYARLFFSNTKIIVLSSAAVYGNANNSIISENDQPNPISPYGVQKKIAEDICKSYSINFGLQISILRLFSVYGNGLKKQLIWDACNKAKLGIYDFFGTGKEVRDWIHVTDAASLVYFLINTKLEDYSVFNGATGNGVEVAEIIKLIYEKLEISKMPIFNTKAKLGDPFGYIADVEKVKKLGWIPQTNLSKGIEEYVNWFKREM